MEAGGGMNGGRRRDEWRQEASIVISARTVSLSGPRPASYRGIRIVIVRTFVAPFTSLKLRIVGNPRDATRRRAYPHKSCTRAYPYKSSRIRAYPHKSRDDTLTQSLSRTHRASVLNGWRSPAFLWSISEPLADQATPFSDAHRGVGSAHWGSPLPWGRLGSARPGGT